MSRVPQSAPSTASSEALGDALPPARDARVAPRPARSTRNAVPARAALRTVHGAGSDRPRERLAADGARALSDAELVALLLRTGFAGGTATEVAARVLEALWGWRGVGAAELAELESLPGLGPAKAASLLAAAELGRRAAERPLEPGALLRGPEDVHRHFGPRLRDEKTERFLVLLLDGRHRVLGDFTVSQGTLTASLVHPREVFRPAIRRAAAAVVLVHNHPSGDPSPSSEDHEVTRRLCESGELLGIRVVDHVVVADGGYYSFEEGGAIPRSGR